MLIIYKSRSQLSGLRERMRKSLSWVLNALKSVRAPTLLPGTMPLLLSWDVVEAIKQSTAFCRRFHFSFSVILLTSQPVRELKVQARKEMTLFLIVFIGATLVNKNYVGFKCTIL